jgi:hypothetical protein
MVTDDSAMNDRQSLINEGWLHILELVHAIACIGAPCDRFNRLRSRIEYGTNVQEINYICNW